MRCLEKKPERRFASVAELRRELKRLQDRKSAEEPLRTATAVDEPQRRGEKVDVGEKPKSRPPEELENLEELIERAERGDVRAQVDLAVRFRDGGGEVNDGLAIKWFPKAAEQGDAAGQVNLGRMYSQGHGVPKDDVEAVKWYRKAAEQGSADGQFNLGWMYAQGRGVPEDEVEAAKWILKAAEQGDARAQSDLVSRYREGRGVARDEKQALHWIPRVYARRRRADGTFLVDASKLRENSPRWIMSGPGMLQSSTTPWTKRNVPSAGEMLSKK